MNFLPSVSIDNMSAEYENEEFRTLRRQYFALYPLHQLRLPQAQVLARNQMFLRGQMLEDPKLERYQPESGYRKSFWRRIIGALEEGVQRLAGEDEEVVSISCRDELKANG